MENLDKLLAKIEENYHIKDKKETIDVEIGGVTYSVETLSRMEKAELFFSKRAKTFSIGEIYEWLKPSIYKAFKLKDAAIKAKENGFIKTYYEVIDMLFEPEEISFIINFMIEKNGLNSFEKGGLELEKKQ